jgi:hypothetical protein
MPIITFSESNSGGRFRLTADDYRALLESGRWGLPEESLERPYISAGDPKEFILRHNLSGEFTSAAEAIAHWESVIKVDANAAGCECCGRPYSFYEGIESGPIIYIGATGIRALLNESRASLSAPSIKPPSLSI